MRKLVLSILVTAVSLVAASVATIAAPAGAAGIVDLSAASSANPTSVSPPGANVIYTTTFGNEGLVAVDGLFENATTNGKLVTATSSIAGACAIPAAGTADPVISCARNLAAGATLVVQVIIETPTTALSTVTNVATARVNPALVQAIDLYPANDTSTVATPVKDSTGVAGTGAAAFVPEGGTLRFRAHVLTVREADLGVVAYMDDVDAPQAADCGGVACQIGLHVDFDQDPRFFGLVNVNVNFGPSDPCRGLGTGKCHPLYFRKGPLEPTAPVLSCGTQGANDPCLERIYKDGVDFHFVVVMETNDPDLLSPVKSLAGSTSG